MDSIAVIAQPTRLQIVRLLWEGERTAGEIAASFELTFGAISQHLRTLEEAGIVEARREWRHRYYRARKEVLGPLVFYLETTSKGRSRNVKRPSPPKPKNKWPSGWMQAP